MELTLPPVPALFGTPATVAAMREVLRRSVPPAPASPGTPVLVPAPCIVVTGPPGCGKSWLLNLAAARWRHLASPFAKTLDTKAFEMLAKMKCAAADESDVLVCLDFDALACLDVLQDWVAKPTRRATLLLCGRSLYGSATRGQEGQEEAEDAQEKKEDAEAESEGTRGARKGYGRGRRHGKNDAKNDAKNEGKEATRARQKIRTTNLGFLRPTPIAAQVRKFGHAFHHAFSVTPLQASSSSDRAVLLRYARAIRDAAANAETGANAASAMSACPSPQRQPVNSKFPS